MLPSSLLMALKKYLHRYINHPPLFYPLGSLHHVFFSPRAHANSILMHSEGPQRVAVPVLALRGVFQIEEGVRGPLAEQARAQGDGQRRQAQVAEGDAGAEQGM